jgi:hypothetical protein
VNEAPAKPSDDDLADLPALEGDEAGVELDLADEIDDSGGEDVGLDAATGTDDDDDDLDELDDEPSGGWEAEAGPPGEDPELEDGDEDGWTAGSDDAEAPGWDEDVEDDDASSSARELVSDKGEEGVDEPGSEIPGEDDAPPQASSREEELADDLQLDADGEIESPADDRPEHPALRLPREERARVEWLGPRGEAIVAVDLEGGSFSSAPRSGGGVACGRALHRIVGGGLEVLEAVGLDGDEPTSIAHVASGAWIVGLRIGGAARSEDGRSFVPLATRRGDGERSSGPFYVLAERYPSGVRVWGRTRAGALSRSEDEGETWSRPLLPGPVISLARAGVPGEGGGVVGVLGGRRTAGSPLRVVRTSDGGRSWRSIQGPTLDQLPDECEVHAAAIGRHIVIACDAPGVGPFASRDEGHTWRIAEPIRDAGPLAAVREDGEDVLYAGLFFEGLDRGLVVRLPLDRESDAKIVIDLEEVRARHGLARAGDSEGEQRIHAIEARASERGTEIAVASGIGLVRAILPRGGTSGA